MFSFRDQSLPASVYASPTKIAPKATVSSDSNTPNLEQSRKKGHLRGTRSNGFASAPPFPRKPNREGMFFEFIAELFNFSALVHDGRETKTSTN